MVDPGVDPRYAATGGRLDGPSMGPSRQEALQQLEVRGSAYLRAGACAWLDAPSVAH